LVVSYTPSLAGAVAFIAAFALVLLVLGIGAKAAEESPSVD
jgi:hypothetical protein